MKRKTKKKVVLKKEIEPADEVETHVEEVVEEQPKKIRTKGRAGKRLTKPVPEEEPAESAEEDSEAKTARPDVIFKFYCMYCGQPLAASEAEIGENTDCPACDQHISIPEKVSVSKNLEAWQTAHDVPAEGVYKFYCPSCDQKLGVKYDLGGKKIKCPTCAKRVYVPELINP